MRSAIAVLSAAVLLGAVTGGAGTPPQTRATRADVERWMKELSNWGRWGKEDQLGAANLITPAKRKAAAALVREGFSVSLARDAEKEKGVDNGNPFGHTMNWTGANTPGQFRMAQAMVPGSPVVMELVEYENHNKKFRKANIQDPGLFLSYIVAPFVRE